MWAPEIAPKVRINATKPAPVAMVFAKRAIATLPPARRSAMIPEPITMASKSAVLTSSAAALRARSGAAATGLRLDGVEGGDAAARSHCLLLHDGRFALDHEDLPGVAVRILHPNFVLNRIAARRVFLGP